MAYQPGIPTGLIPLNQDYVNLQNNFGQINTQYNVDHVPLTSTSGTPPNGYHTIIHEATQTSVNTVPGISQLFSGIAGTLMVNSVLTPAIPANGDTQFYVLSGQGGLSQITGSNHAANGYFYAGGILIQYGSITATNNSFQTLTFNPPFPNNCFAVFTQIYGTGLVASGNGNIDIRKSTISKTSFEWAMVTSSAQYTGFYWIAIGD